MSSVRVRPYSEGGPCAVRHPEHGEMVVPNPAEAFDANDPLVIAYPWLFVADDGNGPVEQATAAPGEKRLVKRR